MSEESISERAARLSKQINELDLSEVSPESHARLIDAMEELKRAVLNNVWKHGGMEGVEQTMSDFETCECGYRSEYPACPICDKEKHQ